MTSKVVIVGGGTAGWITAGLIAAEWGRRADGEVDVLLIESPDVKTIGVGEGTWPTMRGTLQKLGIEESEFLAECSAAFKQGTQFVDWVSGMPGDRYYHPFTPPSGYPRFDLTPYWQERRAEVSFVDAVTPQGKACEAGLAPREASAGDYAALLNYGYHLDAGRFATLLQRHCTGKLGVRHLQDHVTGIEGNPDADIVGLHTQNNGMISGDLFIDCTGLASLLLGQHYQVPFVDCSGVLFNDTALAAQVPHATPGAPVACNTLSTAREAGWVWDIGLPSRRGVGYTYSSAHSTEQAAVEVLQQYLEDAGLTQGDDVDWRKISFRSGHRERFWHRNCVAVGLSAGFLEPLEASALVLIELSAAMISDRLPANRDLMSSTARQFNEVFRYRWDRIIEFLKLHYWLSRRNETEYWRDNRDAATVPDRLAELLELWRYQFPRHDDFPQVDEVFSAASYQYVLYGMGFETHSIRPLEAAREQAQRRLVANSQATRSLLQRLPEHRALLSQTAHAPTTRQVGGR